MEEINLENFIKEQWEKFSPEMRQAILESDWRARTLSVAKKQELNEEQTEKLKQEVTILLFGATHPADFFENIQENLKLTNEKTISVVSDINDRVMSKINDKAKEKKAPELEPKQEEKLTKEQETGLNLLNQIPKEEEKPLTIEEEFLINLYHTKPEPIKELLVNKELVEKIAMIGNKFNLHSEDLSKIENEIIFALLLDEKKDKKIGETTNIPENIKGEVSKLIEENILNPLTKNMEEAVRKFKESLGKEGLMKELPDLTIKEV